MPLDSMLSLLTIWVEFKEIQPNEAPQPVTTDMDNRYVTREEFERFLSNIKAQPEEKGEMKHE